MANTRLFLFDLDGTVVSTGGAGLKALDKTYSELFNLSNVMETVNPSGKTDPAIFREIVRRNLTRDIRPEEMAQVSETYLKYLTKEMENNTLLVTLPGVASFLDYLDSLDDAIYGLGTGNLEQGARTKLAPTGLNDRFKFGGFGSDAEDRAEVLRTGHKRAEEALGEPIIKANVYIIGDTLLDTLAARRAGFRSIAVATGSKTLEELEQGRPDYLWKDLTEGPYFVEKMQKNGVV